MATFASRQTRGLLTTIAPPTTSGEGDDHHNLQAYFVALTPPTSSFSPKTAREALGYLVTLQRKKSQPLDVSPVSLGVDEVTEEEEERLAAGVLYRVTIALYAEILDEHLAQASAAETEAEWWADIERSRLSTFYYLIQTLPGRLQDVFLEIVSALRSRNLPVRPSAFTLSSIRTLFPARSAFSPGPLVSAFYPHLKSHPHALALSVPRASMQTASLSGARTLASSWAALVQTAVQAPLSLAAQECTLKRDSLRKLRDDRAATLGALLLKQSALERAINVAAQDDSPALSTMARITLELQALVHPEAHVAQSNDDLVGHLSVLATRSVPAQRDAHAEHLRSNRLLRPSYVVRAWPRLLLYPPLVLYTVKTVYGSRQELVELANTALDTADRFWHDWLLEPLRGVVKTVRAGTDQGVIVNAKGVAADIDSLERMSLALAQDKRSYTAEQLANLTLQIRQGDLTPVLRIYEDDIRSPLKSAIGGTLLRSLFIQVQKAKVDIDQALAGIDKLLKSQELTFAFVGVAPAFAIVWAMSRAARRFWIGGSRNSRYGGQSARARTLASMRRIERLLVSSSTTASPDQENVTSDLPPLTTGLLVLSLAHVRRYAERSLPIASRIREGMLEDIDDLEDPSLGRMAKIKVVERMWRCWGGPLGWGGH